MKKILLSCLLAATILGVTACGSSDSGNGEGVVTSNSDIEGTKFISVEEAKELIDSDEDVVVFGVLSSAKAIIPLTDENSPIDGTYRVWREDYSGKGSTEAVSPNYGGFRKDSETMDDLLSKAGVTENSKIIVYSTGSMHDSTRFGWQLELVGLEPMYLDGGLNAWKAAGYETGDQVTLADEDVKSEFSSTEWNLEELEANLDDVVNALENPDEWVVIDTRSTDEFNGEKTGSSSGAFGTGTMKGAVHIEWTNALNEDKTMKTKAELEEIYGDVIEGKKVITFCQSGVRSSHTQMVLREMLGVEDVYNYDGSWIEWSYVASEAGDDVDGALKEKVLGLTDKWSDNKKEI